MVRGLLLLEKQSKNSNAPLTCGKAERARAKTNALHTPGPAEPGIPQRGKCRAADTAHPAGSPDQNRQRPDRPPPRLHAAGLRTGASEPCSLRPMACRPEQRGPLLRGCAQAAARSRPSRQHDLLTLQGPVCRRRVGYLAPSGYPERPARQAIQDRRDPLAEGATGVR